MSTLRFEQRPDKEDKNGNCPIRIIYQVSGQRKYYPTSIKCLPFNWSARNQEFVFLDKRKVKEASQSLSQECFLTEAQVREFNSRLAEIRREIENIEKRFALDGFTYTPSMVLERLSAKRKPEAAKDDAGKSVTAFINRFIEESAATHKTGTLKVYMGLANHLEAFEQSTGNKALFEKIDLPYIRAFHNFLATSRQLRKGTKVMAFSPMNNITSAKTISTLKTILNYARTVYKISVNLDYRDYKVTRKDSDFEVITLSYEEFETLYNLNLSRSRKLAQVRDVFCFSCATGLRYSDLVQLKREHIRQDMIVMTASKTGQRLEIPLNPFSASILKKYSEGLKPLPVISNQKTNDYLKELCKIAGIDTPIEIVREYGIKRQAVVYPKYELVSIHVGRKTFTTLSLEKGIAPQDVMAITGHTTFKSFKRYVEVSSKRKQTVMEQAWGKVKTESLKAV